MLITLSSILGPTERVWRCRALAAGGVVGSGAVGVGAEEDEARGRGSADVDAALGWAGSILSEVGGLRVRNSCCETECWW